MFSVVGQDGRIYGPVDMATLEQWIGQGRVLPNTLLIDPITNQQGPAGSFVLVQPYFVAATPPQAIQPINQSVHSGYPPVQTGHGNVQVVVQNVIPGHPGVVPNTGYRSKVTAALLAFFLGGIGVHQFYLGKNALGVTMLLIFLLTCGWGGIATGIWAIIDLVIILTGGMRDAEGKPLV